MMVKVSSGDGELERLRGVEEDERPGRPVRRYRLASEELAALWRAYGPPGYTTDPVRRRPARPWPPKNPAEAERLVQKALAEFESRDPNGEKDTRRPPPGRLRKKGR